MAEGDINKGYTVMTSNTPGTYVENMEDPNFHEMQRLHPKTAPLLDDNDLASPDVTDAPLTTATFTEDDLRWAINNSSCASAAGPSGWCITFLQHFVTHAKDTHR